MKTPAFQFYPADFLSDENVVLMSNRELGCYIKLMCYCWREGSIPSDLKKIARLCGEDGSAMADLWIAIGVCFEVSGSDESRMVHPRLETERLKQSEFKTERSESGKKGAEARWNKGSSKNSSAMAQPLAQPMANDGSSSSSSSSEVSECVVTPITPQSNEPDANPSRRGELSALLRGQGVDITPANPDLCRWVESGLTNDEAQEAVDRARLCKPAPEKIPAKYLAAIVPKVIEDRDAPSGPLPRASPTRKHGGARDIGQQNRDAAKRAKAMLFGDKGSVIEGEVIRERA
jgi:uncharacterized protein YdaU (DUF1376 family)